MIEKFIKKARDPYMDFLHSRLTFDFSSLTWTSPSTPKLKVAFLFLGNTSDIPIPLSKTRPKESKRCWVANSSPIGAVTEMSGKHTDAPVHPNLKHAAYSPLSARNCTRVNVLRISSRISRQEKMSTPISTLHLQSMTSSNSAIILGRDTNRVISSLIGVPFPSSTPFSPLQRVMDLAIS